MKPLNEPLICRATEHIPDWYLIERAEHDGRSWIEYDGDGGGRLCISARITNADIEGPSGEMLVLARAILAGLSVHFHRCAAEHTDFGYLLSSPRNSTNPCLVSFEVARALAQQILALFGETQ